MASDEWRHWCHRCNEPVWVRGPDLICPYCHGGFVQEMSSSQSANPPLLPPWLTQQAADTARRLYNAIFPPTTDRSVDPRIRPAPIPGFYGHGACPHYPRPGFYYEIEGGVPGYHIHIHHDPGHHHHHHHRSYDEDEVVQDEVIEAGTHTSMDDVDVDYDPHRQHHHHHRIDHDHDHYDEDEDDQDEVVHAIAQMSMDDDGHHGPPRASESAIRALPTVRISAQHLNGEGTCPVCQDKFERGSSARQMPCQHIFHSDCIVPWLQQHNTCPVCRFELSTVESSSRTRRTRSNSIRLMNPLSCLLPRLRNRHR